MNRIIVRIGPKIAGLPKVNQFRADSVRWMSVNSIKWANWNRHVISIITNCSLTSSTLESFRRREHKKHNSLACKSSVHRQWNWSEMENWSLPLRNGKCVENNNWIIAHVPPDSRNINWTDAMVVRLGNGETHSIFSAQSLDRLPLWQTEQWQRRNDHCVECARVIHCSCKIQTILNLIVWMWVRWSDSCLMADVTAIWIEAAKITQNNGLIEICKQQQSNPGGHSTHSIRTIACWDISINLEPIGKQVAEPDCNYSV